MPLGHRVRDIGVFRLQVEDVKLVDARRHHHQRALRDARRGRRVLDQLEEFVFKHHCTRRGREIAADLKGRFVRLADVALAGIGDEVGNAPRNALPIRLEREPDRLGIGGGEIRRAACIDPLANGEPQLVLGMRLDLRRLHQFVQVARGEQVGLLQVIVIGNIPPLRRGKALVAAGGRSDGRQWRSTGIPRHHRHPKPRLAFGILGLHPGKMRRIDRQGRGPEWRACGQRRRSCRVRDRAHPSLAHGAARLQNRRDQCVRRLKLVLHVPTLVCMCAPWNQARR